jgi:hypothetical protein
MKKGMTVALMLPLCLAAGGAGEEKKEAKEEARLFEMRIYYAAEGKMEALHKRFNDHTCKLFKKHGMTLIGFWSPTDEKEAEKKMIYILAHADKASAEKSWKAFRADKDWVKARDASEKGGKLVAKIEVVWMKGTEYSPMK